MGFIWIAAPHVCRQQINADVHGATQSSAPPPHALPKNVGPMRLLACVIAAVVYVWQEEKEFAFSQLQLAAVILGVGFLSACLCLFRRGPSRIQPPEGMPAPCASLVGTH